MDADTRGVEPQRTWAGGRPTAELTVPGLPSDRLRPAAPWYVSPADASRRKTPFSAIVEHSSELVAVVAPDAIISYVSPSVTALLGYAPADVEGACVFDFLHPDEAEEAARAFKVALEAPGIGLPLEYRLRAADGRWTAFEIVASNMCDDASVAGIVFHGRDVTERYESQRRYRLLFEQSPIAQAALHPDRTAVVANRAFAALFASTGESLKTRSLRSLVHPEDQAGFVEATAGLVSGRRESIVTECRFVRDDGTSFYGRITATAARDLNGNLEYVLVTIDDISAQHDAASRVATSEARFRALIDHSPDIIVVVQPDGRWNASEQGVRLLGYPHDFRVDGGVFALVHPDDLELAVTAYNEVVAGTRAGDDPVELRFRSATGEYLPFECVGRNLGDNDAVGGVVITARNITERKRMESALVAAEARFQAVFEHAPFSVSVVDFEGTILDINYAGCTMVGRSRESLIGTPAHETVHPDDIDRVIEVTTRQLAGSDEVAEFRLVNGGRDVWVMSSASVIEPGGGNAPYIVTIQADITERRQLEDRLAHEATRDPLTGLFNRGAFLTQMELAIARRSANPLVLLFVDLDHFKQVNDTLGHDAGDTVLVTIAKRMQEVVREGDIVSRIGGDEFVILCNDVGDHAEAMRLAERVRATADRPIDIRGARAQIGASVGVVVGRHGDAAATLLRAADIACYRAKRNGRGRVEIATGNPN